MKIFENMNFCKIKKITAIELSVIFLALIAIGVYYSPNFMHNQEVMMAAKIKADSAIFTSKALEEFSLNSKIKPSEVAQKVAGELNLTTQNPYNKKAQAYTFETTCKGCNSVEFDDKSNMIVLTTFNNKGELMARTVIKPPSFVVYSKGE